MFKLNKVDKEIVYILKKTFLAKNIRPIMSDEHMRVWMVRMLFVMSILCLVTRVFLGLRGDDIPSEVSSFLSMSIALFFGVLFIHINNESENTSLLVFGITWISIVLTLDQRGQSN